MPEAFKNIYNESVVCQLAEALEHAWKPFDKSRFVDSVMIRLHSLELKARANLICDCLKTTLPEDFDKSSRIIHKVINQLPDKPVNPWALMSLGLYVAETGLCLDSLFHSLDLLQQLTRHFSSEFAIRPFLKEFPEQSMSTLHIWANHESPHVRRLASEGSRPRLPWGMQLPALIKDPSPLFPLLEKLKDDSELFVRRSVANNLNDIAKDHPDKVADLAEQWMHKCSQQRKALIKHALRTLLKNGHPKALALFGFNPPEIEITGFWIKNPVVHYGQSLQFELEMVLPETAEISPSKLQIDFRIHFLKANGKQKPKVFKGSVLTIKRGKTMTFTGKRAIVPITTRKYYAGKQYLDFCINGKIYPGQEFELIM